MKTTTATTALALIAAVTLTACAGEIATRGNLLTPERLALIQPGKATRADVERVLGAPSHIPMFGNDKPWYYIYKRISSFAFLNPEILEQKVVAVFFDNDDKVKDLQLYPRQRAIEVAMLARTTPTQGRELTFLDQLFTSQPRLANTTPAPP